MCIEPSEARRRWCTHYTHTHEILTRATCIEHIYAEYWCSLADETMAETRRISFHCHNKIFCCRQHNAMQSRLQCAHKFIALCMHEWNWFTATRMKFSFWRLLPACSNFKLEYEYFCAKLTFGRGWDERTSALALLHTYSLYVKQCNYIKYGIKTNYCQFGIIYLIRKVSLVSADIISTYKCLNAWLNCCMQNYSSHAMNMHFDNMNTMCLVVFSEPIYDDMT